MTTVRLAYGGPPEALALGLSSPTVRLAWGNGPGCRGDSLCSEEMKPALLVSFWYYSKFAEQRHRYSFRDWSMDSGAYSAANSGVKIDLQEYIETCQELLATDDQLTEVFALDVIGDWRASLRNTEEMWRQGVPAIPCYHTGEPWDVAVGIARDYPKIAFGGNLGVPMKKKLHTAKQLFSRVWPKRVHGFGFGGERGLMTVPFHSTDATNWELGPCAFGSWRTFGKMSVRGGRQNLRSEVEWFMRLERKVQWRWRKEMALLRGDDV